MARTTREENTSEQADQQPQAKKKGLALKWILITLAAVVVLGGIGGGAYYYFSSHAGKAKKQDPAPAVIGTIWPMEPFIINIQDSGSDRYLKLVVQLEIADAQGVKDLDLLKPKLRDNILELLGAKTYRELMDTAGKQRLREEIAMRLNSFLTTTKVTRVYFTEFVIQ
ncbi:MAG TPA: flagellar basal body-associated FliL family protein [Syntrophales bacterium]|jgi:flagellar FliL protein|nr:flagellar basal body-associated FliL family protein [Syntrophales bacterium]HOU77077.1 flagellar basal body-associated FliL family protein [Syntrophales bacterium]HPC33123.1 flagellar basal body-associated FliL family protein [Syntrophales bacterium]HQG35339.1 flagellar basal body-associated FliL family protein [Syntrophales bacterium]HQI35583.1 flagellar basal body-associated FliL family protein [Syntrophales bacterium]